MTRNTTGHIHAQTPSPVKYAAGRSFQRVPALITEITVQTAFTASIWTINQGTGSQNAMDVWSRSVSGSGKTEQWAIIHRCVRCGKISSNRVAADDNPMKLTALAMRPFGSTMISREEIRGMTASMEG